MFLENSRYFAVRQVQATARGGRPVTAVALRRLPPVAGEPLTVAGGDRLDLLAQKLYGDATLFWHVADANTELEAAELTRPAGRVILAPKT